LCDVKLLRCVFSRHLSDAELQRRKLEESRQGARLAQERFRQIELDIDDASRALRKTRAQAQIARDQLEELKDRHWAILSFYDPDQAEEQVKEALNEFQQLEPAARLGDFIVRPAENVELSPETTKKSGVADAKLSNDGTNIS
jgi:hypothetical protein